MSFKVTKEGLTVEVDTEAELKLVLNAFGLKQHTVSIRPSDFVPDIDSLVRVYKSILPDTKSYEMLHFLKERPKGATNNELIKRLNLSGGQSLGGIFGGIRKHADEFGVRTDDIYKWEYINGNDTYRLTENMVGAISKAEKE